ncbi:Rieske 2Fe-2S domain-containing protein [Peribacillus simplex]|uniref:Rieske 2Fe-2S domain-containing protein n=1 Tax=Peribacillus simplex TaxID=1478 RepID=UPI003CF58909
MAAVGEVSEKPIGIKLLGVHLVLYRASGKIIVARDLCLHRGGRRVMKSYALTTVFGTLFFYRHYLIAFRWSFCTKKHQNTNGNVNEVIGERK